MGKLEDKVAIITGGGGWLGRGMALAFAKEDAKVVIAERHVERGAAVAREIHELGKQALAVPCDVGVEEQVKGMVQQAVDHFGPIDILVNNAQARGPRGQTDLPFEELPESTWDIVFQTGVKATFFCCKAVFPYMKGRGGKIINLGSPAGLIGRPLSVDYNACKEAIRALTRTAAREWGKYKINVNVICPASPSEAYQRTHAEEMRLLAEQIPLRRNGDPERDIGRAAVFLGSEDSDFITGQTIMVDGGIYMFP